MHPLAILAPAWRRAPAAGIVAEALQEVEEVFRRQLRSDLPAVNELSRHVERYRGKMLRPTLLLLSGLAATGREDEAALTRQHKMAAAVAEMIHMATLVHDDVLDDADIRRGGATINSLRGNETAVMLGDWLISNAFHLCSLIGDPALNVAFGQTTNTLCEGELLQLSRREDVCLDEHTYLEIVRRKTASLVATCCQLGATLSGAGEAVQKALALYGQHTGVAFQIQDDILDFTGDQGVVGKTLGCDLVKGKATLPLILFLRDCAGADRAAAIDVIESRDRAELVRRMQQRGSIEAAQSVAERMVAVAQESLTPLPKGQVKTLLRELATEVVRRDR
jgi:octaprenyl-diphosphate synthase